MQRLKCRCISVVTVVSAAAFFRETHCNSANYSNWMCRILLAIENWFLWSVRQLLVWNTGEEVNQKHFRSLAHFQAAKMNTFDVAGNFWHVFASLTNVSLHQWNAHFEAWKFLIEAINILSRAGISCEWNIIRSEFVWRARKNHVVTLAVTFVNEIRGALEHNVTVLNLFTALMPIIPASYCLQSFGTLNASESGVFTVLLCILTVGKTFIMKYFTHILNLPHATTNYPNWRSTNEDILWHWRCCTANQSIKMSLGNSWPRLIVAFDGLCSKLTWNTFSRTCSWLSPPLKWHIVSGGNLIVEFA